MGSVEEKISHSPALSKQKPAPSKDQRLMTFGECLKEALNGGKFRRLEWEDLGIYLTIKDEKLMVYLTSDKTLHPLTVSVGDIAGEDWIRV